MTNRDHGLPLCKPELKITFGLFGTAFQNEFQISRIAHAILLKHPTLET